MPFPSRVPWPEKVSTRSLPVAIACKRARQINRGAPARVVSHHHKPTSVALEEIAAARVPYRVRDERETAIA